ncbi:hypothetical protein FJV41_15655 [Myxococcus llanfairpwllgwyngyllgogerychwyrndrobwllllantysiliogogogochensis]|uniref:Lipoprotein n=1 Tax=Myxococcus llanfairpwllgwyngyllgogerychwyrndrobwllllantysiliogogogochensis TaxID=2590453 RepID=A0A540X158_9BACT|nr:hypothetical protein [Myxococcus llanfairpwllgwyngyllgogerychwyrndrobwllllantysiliogogogochensis]TQF15017.1 hypothetical protein FJV41_15655 [Myxococcus llanfairpwllgwyngyllgogerychwyrndrobwllllantysiliogogogochensis]
MALRSPVPLLACGAVLAVVACSLNVDDLAGKACTDNSECPTAYACTALGADGQRTCEVIYPPHYTEADGGADAGPVPTYCKDVEPILAATCVSTCHGADTSGSSQTSFRLDYYEPTGNGVPGARAKALRIRVRASDLKDMPPTGSPQPTTEERALIARWVAGGAPLCDSTGTNDAGP